jgi:hypothetical protein
MAAGTTPGVPVTTVIERAPRASVSALVETVSSNLSCMR